MFVPGKNLEPQTFDLKPAFDFKPTTDNVGLFGVFKAADAPVEVPATSRKVCAAYLKLQPFRRTAVSTTSRSSWRCAAMAAMDFVGETNRNRTKNMKNEGTY